MTDAAATVRDAGALVELLRNQFDVHSRTDPAWGAVQKVLTEEIGPRHGPKEFEALQGRLGAYQDHRMGIQTGTLLLAALTHNKIDGWQGKFLINLLTSWYKSHGASIGANGQFPPPNENEVVRNLIEGFQELKTKLDDASVPVYGRDGKPLEAGKRTGAKKAIDEIVEAIAANGNKLGRDIAGKIQNFLHLVGYDTVKVTNLIDKDTMHALQEWTVTQLPWLHRQDGDLGLIFKVAGLGTPSIPDREFAMSYGRIPDGVPGRSPQFSNRPAYPVFWQRFPSRRDPGLGEA
jgi:hypothetical protein